MSRQNIQNLQLNAIDKFFDEFALLMQPYYERYKICQVINKFPPATEDITVYIAAFAIKKIDYLKEVTKGYRGKSSLLPYQLYTLELRINELINRVRRALADGPSVLNEGFTSSADYEYRISVIAQNNSQPLISEFVDFEIRMQDLTGFLAALKKLSPTTKWQETLLKVKHNQITEQQFSLVEYSEFEKIEDPTIGDEKLEEFCEALSCNRYIKNLTIESENITDNALLDFPIYLTNIHELTIAANSLTDDSLKRIIEIRNIKTLGLKTHLMTDNLLLDLAKQAHIQSLTIESQEVTLSGITALFSNQQLSALTIINHHLTDDDAQLINNALKESKIKHLTLHANNITDQGLYYFATVDCLKSLTCISNKLTQNAIIPFKQNLYLSELILRGSIIRSTGKHGQQFFTESSALNHPNRIAFKRYLLAAEAPEFVNKIKSTNEIAQFVLGDEELNIKLNNLNYPPNEQTFEKSCTAYSIMLLLNKLGCIAEKDVNRKTELTIYTQIWQQPGEEANIGLVIDLLKKYNINCIIYEDTNKINTIFKEHSQFKLHYEGYTLIKSKTNVKLVDAFNMRWPEQSTLMVVVGSASGLHVIIVAHDYNKFYLVDPGNGIRTEGASLSEVVNQQKYSLYTGVVIEVRHCEPAPNLKEHLGFFAHPESADAKYEKPKIDKNQCIIQ